MGSRPISISFDKIYKIVKLCSLNGIFVALRPIAHCIPQFASCYLRVCVCARVHIRQGLQLPWRQFRFICGWQKRPREMQPAERLQCIHHPSMPQRLQTKRFLCLASKRRLRLRPDYKKEREMLRVTPAAAVVEVEPNVHLI